MQQVQLNLRGAFIKSALAIAKNRGDSMAAAQFLEDSGHVNAASIVKASVNPIDGSALIGVRASSDFTQAVQNAEIIGRLRERRTVDFQVAINESGTAVTAYWLSRASVAQIPLTKLSLTGTALAPFTLATIVAFSDAVMRLSNIEAIVDAELKAACVASADRAFVDPNAAGVALEKPASILHGLTAVPGSSNPITDIKNLIADFHGDLATAYFVMHPDSAAHLGLYTSSGNIVFPNVGPRGGDVLGIPVLTSKSVPTTDSNGGIVALIDAAAVTVADDGIALDISKQADLAMADNPAAGGTQRVSLWQTSSAAVRVIRNISWRAAAGRVSYLSGVSW